MAKIPANTSCGICGSQHRLHRHHKDWDHSNNSPSNIIVVCERCHTILHQVGYLTDQELADLRAKVVQRDPNRFSHDTDEQSGSQPPLFS